MATLFENRAKRAWLRVFALVPPHWDGCSNIPEHYSMQANSRELTVMFWRHARASRPV